VNSLFFSKRRIIVGLLIVACIQLPATCWLAHSDVPRERTVPEGLIQKMLRDEIPLLAPKAPVANPKSNFLHTYDLMQQAEEVMRKVTSDEKFKAYIRERKASLSPEQRKSLDHKTQGMWMLEYAQTREDIKPEIKAWLYVLAGPSAQWDKALDAYHQLEKYRPNDFVPAMLIALKLEAPTISSPTVEQWKDVLDIVRRAVPHATNATELLACLAAVGGSASKLRGTESHNEVPLLVWRWLRNVNLSESLTDPENQMRLSFVKSWLALAVKDYVALADLAPRCGMRVLVPMFLSFAGKNEDYYDTLKTLRLDQTLTERERAALRRFEPLMLIMSHHLEEASKAIRQQRENPNLTSKDSEWLDTIERILRDNESAERKREAK
jgi:hypothetical protein